MALQLKEDTLQGEKFGDLVKTVKEEIKKLGDSREADKKNYDEMRSQLADLQGKVDKYGESSQEGLPADIKEHIDKIATDVATRHETIETKAAEYQDALTKSIDERLDDIETSFAGKIKESAPEEKILYGIDQLVLKSGGMRAQERLYGSRADVARAFYANTKVAEKGREAFSAFVEELKEGKYVDEYFEYEKKFRGYLEALNPLAYEANVENAKAMAIGTEPHGGYLVPPQMSARVTERQWEMDPIRQLANVESISALEWVQMQDIDQADAGWEGETETGTETATPSWREKKIPVHVMYAKPRATQTILEDAAMNIENWLVKKVSERFARVEGAAFVVGTGVKTPRGFLDYNNGVGWGNIEQIAVGTVAGVIDTDGLIDTKYHLKEYFLNRGTWLMQRLTVSEVMQLKNAVGDYIWKPGISASDPYSTLLSLPVRMCPSMQAIAASSLSFALADWNEAYTIVDRLGITVQRDPYTVKPYVEFYTRKRVGGDVVNFEAIKIGRVNP